MRTKVGQVMSRIAVPIDDEARLRVVPTKEDAVFLAPEETGSAGVANPLVVGSIPARHVVLLSRLRLRRNWSLEVELEMSVAMMMMMMEENL